MKHLKYSIASLLALLTACSTGEPEEKFLTMTSRVFALAEEKAKDMDQALNPGEFPRTMGSDSTLVTTGHDWWCSGFFPGQLWLLYEYTNDREMLELADKYTMALLPELENPRYSHDIGFQFGCSFCNAYRITHEWKYRQPVIDAANLLAKRFNPNTGCTRSWNPKKGRTWLFPVIVDNMMNLEILFRAAERNADPAFTRIANSHARQTMRNHYREDYTCFHLVDYDPQSGEVILKQTVQGYSDSSSWARGQAWGLYGFTMMAYNTDDIEYLDFAENIAQMLLKRLPEDGIPYWDFDAPDIPQAKRDASAAAIMASAFVQLSTITKSETLCEELMAMAEKQLRTLSSEEYLSPRGENANFLLKHSVGNMPGNSEVDVPLSYADYYYLEALLRMRSVILNKIYLEKTNNK